MTTDIQKEADRIANAIVAYVERADGPVTLCEIEREIPGFAKQEPPAWECYRALGGAESVYWAGMTEAGMLALNAVMFGRRLAIQQTTFVPYLLEGRVVENENWQPVLLLPAKAANLVTPQALFRVPQFALPQLKMKPGWRLVTPAPTGRTADFYPMAA
jgi:hypothetical protein